MTGFKGFGEKAMPFFKALDFHQSREWFKENRALYESELESPRGDLIEALTAAFAENGIPLKGDRKKSTYRIYRDVRFSKDKRPFNRHVSALLTPSGEKREDMGSFFIKIGLEGSFMACGFYLDEPTKLKAFRDRIVAWPDLFRDMAAQLKKGKLSFETTESLKRMPQGFETVTDADLAAAVRLKHFYVMEKIEEKRIHDAELVDDCVRFMKRAMPLLEWGTANAKSS